MTEYTYIISLSGLPNIVGAAGAGLLLDIIGKMYSLTIQLNPNRPVIFASMSILLFGNILAWLACLTDSFPLFLTASFFFSLGAQTFMVACNSLEAFWFQDKETSVAVNLDTSFSFLSVAIVYWGMPKLYNATGSSLTWPFACTIFLTLISAAATYGINIFDKLVVKDDPPKAEESENAVKATETSSDVAVAAAENEVSNDQKPDPLSFSTLKLLGFGYLLLIISYSTRAIGYQLLEFISSEYFQVRFGFNSEDAGAIISIPYFCFAALTAPCGVFIYFFGRKPMISINFHFHSLI